MAYRLLTEFRRVFEGKKYRHRASNTGDLLCLQVYEDLIDLARSTKLNARVASESRVINTGNKRRGVAARRGDGTFGELVPHEVAQRISDFKVGRGHIATVEIGVEVKILAKAMIKQIDRVMNDLRHQVSEFQRGAGNPICIAVVGINHAPYTVSYEGDVAWKTDGRKHKHPITEAAEAEARLVKSVKDLFDEFLILRYRATNEPPFPFEWVNERDTSLDYGAALTRISREYDRRF